MIGREGGTDDCCGRLSLARPTLCDRCHSSVRPSVRSPSAVDTDFFLSFSPHFPHEEQSRAEQSRVFHVVWLIVRNF